MTCRAALGATALVRLHARSQICLRRALGTVVPRALPLVADEVIS